jgi:hypothetical protein
MELTKIQNVEPSLSINQANFMLKLIEIRREEILNGIKK